MQLREIEEELAALDDDEDLSAEHAERIEDAIRGIRNTLDSETVLSIAYLVTDKRIETKKLLDDVESLVAPGVWSELPDLAKFDISEAARCIAFELPTAAAFHSVRATEEVLRHFYRSVVKQKRLKVLNWGPMVDQMRKKKTRRPDDPLLDVLDRIRDNFRNPTQHPEAIYDIHEAQDLFLACLEACSRMTRSEFWT